MLKYTFCSRINLAYLLTHFTSNYTSYYSQYNLGRFCRMADTQGDGGLGLFGGSSGVNSRSQTRPRKKDKAWCLLCLKSGRKSKLQLFQIGSNEAMYLCSNETCPYPLLMTEDLHGSVVTRDLSELKVTSPHETNSGRFHSTNNFPTSMPIVVPVEVQKIPIIQKEDTIPKRTPNLMKDISDDSLLQFRIWMRDKKRPIRNNSITHDEASKNEEQKEKADISVGKRPRVRSNHFEGDSETELGPKNKIESHSHKLSSKAHRHFSTPSIRKIDKTLMEASGVNVDKKFEPFKITPKNEIPKPVSPVPQEPELTAEDKIINNEDPLVEPTTEELSTMNVESQSQNSILQINNNTNDIPIENNIPNHVNGEEHTTHVPPLDLVHMNSQMLSPEQWHQPQIHPPHMAIQNGHVNNPLYHTSLIPPPLYLHSNYPMMPPQYNSLIPPPSNYHNMATSLQSPLSPIPHTPNDYVISPSDPSQFYYPDSLYADYTDQWEELDLTNMLDSIDTNQFDPVLGILTPASATDNGLYDLMDPSTMATSTGPYDCPHPPLEVPNNTPILDPPNSLPLINSSAPLNGTSGDITVELQEIVSTIDSNNTRGDEAANFNNNQESPLSSYQSPLSQGEYQNVSLVGSAT